MTDTTTAPPPALTRLSEEERLFADSVYEFAQREVRPLVREMDEHGAMNKAAAAQDLRPGHHGHRDPRGLRRRRRHAVPLRAGGRGALAGRSRPGRARGRAEHAGRQLRGALGQHRREGPLPAPPGGEHHRRVLSVGGRVRFRRVRAHDPRRRGRRRLPALRAASCGSPTPTRPTSSSSSPPSIPMRVTRASRRSSSSAACRASPWARRKTSSASAPAAPASCSSTTAWCPRPTSSARSARATRWPWRRSTKAGSASARRCSAWPRAPSITPWRT